MRLEALLNTRLVFVVVVVVVVIVQVSQPCSSTYSDVAISRSVYIPSCPFSF